jgi:hypothetical protein
MRAVAECFLPPRLELANSSQETGHSASNRPDFEILQQLRQAIEYVARKEYNPPPRSVQPILGMAKMRWRLFMFGALVLGTLFCASSIIIPTRDPFHVKIRGGEPIEITAAVGPINVQAIKSIEKVFYVSNFTKRTITVDSLRPSCSCAEASITSRTIAPGETAELRLLLNTQHKHTGNHRISCQLVEESGLIHSLGMDCFLFRPLEVGLPEELLLQKAVGEEMRTSTIDVFSYALSPDGLAENAVVSFEPVNAGIDGKVELAKEERMPNGLYVRAIKFHGNIKTWPGDYAGECNARVIAKTKSGSELIAVIPVRWRNLQAVTVAPQSIVVGVEKGEREYTAQISLTREDKAFRVVKTESDSSFVKHFATAGSSKTHAITVQIDLSSIDERLVSSLTVKFDDGVTRKIPVIVLLRTPFAQGENEHAENASIAHGR